MNLDCNRLQADAEQAGRRCVAGALITDDAERVLVVRRSPRCDFMPGCWDIVGGHVEPGEGLLDALTREVEEETGWAGAAPRMLLAVDEWRGSAGETRREFDFLVGVDGDLDRPRLASDEHVEHRWIGADDLGVLDETAPADGGLVRRSVQRALATTATPPSHPHTAILVDPVAAEPIEELRRKWDPAMAAQIGAHVTVTYPDEVADTDLLREHVAELTAMLPRFRLRLGGLSVFDRPEGGCYVEVEDLDGSYAGLRAGILRPPLTSTARTHAHVTVVHPRTSGLGPIAWRQLDGVRFDIEFTVREIVITAFDRTIWRTVDRFTLGS